MTITNPQNSQLGFVPVSILGAKIGAKAVATVASNILPKIFADKYAAANQAAGQVQDLSRTNTQSLDQIRLAAGQIENAYRQTTEATQAKVNQLKNETGTSQKNKSILTLTIATVLISATGVAIHKLA